MKKNWNSSEAQVRQTQSLASRAMRLGDPRLTAVTGGAGSLSGVYAKPILPP